MPECNNKSAPYTARRGELSEQEMQMARIAWKYFENNYQANTGLVNAVNMYPSVTMWDMASYLGGLTAAYELEIITKNEFDTRLVTLLKTLNEMKFFQNELPNKVYHTQTAEKVNYSNKPGEIGFSALDLGRFLIWAKIIKERYPQHANGIDNFVLRWNFCNVLDENGTMFGSAVTQEGKTIYLQEGRLGYEEYAAKGFALWGFNTKRSSKPEPYEYVNIYDIPIPYDTRDPRKLGAHNYVVAESYVLDAIELGWDLPDDFCSDDRSFTDCTVSQFAQYIYRVQEKRYQLSGIITARTEHQLDQKPYFVYDAIFTDGYPWNTITEKGDYVPQYSAIALKGALGMWAVWKTDYTDLLFETINGLYDEQKGFYEGLYENGNGVINTFTSNNNGIMLECLLYKKQGKLLKFSGRESLWDSTLKNEFKSGKCRRERMRQESKDCTECDND